MREKYVSEYLTPRDGGVKDERVAGTWSRLDSQDPLKRPPTLMWKRLFWTWGGTLGVKLEQEVT